MWPFPLCFEGIAENMISLLEHFHNSVLSAGKLKSCILKVADYFCWWNSFEIIFPKEINWHDSASARIIFLCSKICLNYLEDFVSTNDISLDLYLFLILQRFVTIFQLFVFASVETSQLKHQLGFFHSRIIFQYIQTSVKITRVSIDLIA